MQAIVVSRPPQPVEIDVLARRSGVHPDLVARLVRLGLIETVRPPSSGRSFRLTQRRGWRAPSVCAAISD